MWDKRHSQRHPSVANQADNISSSPEVQDKSTSKQSQAVQDMAVPVAVSRPTFGHQYSWTRTPNTPQTQLGMGYTESMGPTISKCGLYTAPTTVSAYPVPSSYEFGSITQDASYNSNTMDHDISIPPMSLDGGSPPQLRHTSSSFSMMSTPSSQPLLQTPGSWAQPSPDWTYLPVQTPPRSESNFSSPRSDVQVQPSDGYRT